MEYRTEGKNLYLLRGLPGSGKSTLARMMSDVHFEADMFFLNNDGVYNFNPSKLKNAHEWCQNQVHNAMILNHTTGGLSNSNIVVSNTFTQEWEMEPYYEFARAWGYKVFSIIVENRHGGVNEHGVPDDKLEQMKNRFEVKL
jgi:ABC-type molybdenum transport system ATPase subunit/photorepair protein PhrA